MLLKALLVLVELAAADAQLAAGLTHIAQGFGKGQHLQPVLGQLTLTGSGHGILSFAFDYISLCPRRRFTVQFEKLHACDRISVC